MKQRFSSLDIKVIAHELQSSIVSLRAVNIYDLSSRIFLFKFQKPGHKEHFLIDSGFRCHLTAYARTTANSPSAFVQRLRKFLRDRRLTSVSQVGTDRILELSFSDGRYRLFLEFYAGGNVILTDHELKVIALLRQVNEGAPHELIKLGGTYNLSERQNVAGIEPLTEQRIRNGLQKFVDKQAVGEFSTNKKLKKKAGDALRKALAGFISEFPPMLLDHSLRSKGFDIELQPEDVLKDDALITSLLEGLQDANRTMETVMSASVAKGFIFGKPKPVDAADAEKPDATGEERSGMFYNDFHPFKPKHLVDDPGNKILEMEGFNKTVDEFYSSIEGQKLESKLAEREQNARKKIENARSDQAKRLGGLQEVQALNERKAAAIEANVARVEETTAAINGLIAQGKDWDEIDKLIQLEKRRGNPVAEIIKLPLKLNENTATLLLGEWEADADDYNDDDDASASEPSDSEDENAAASKKSKPAPADKRLAVDIDLALSPWSNAREYYDQKKTAAAKEEKTMQASAKALKSTERKVQADLSKALKQEKQVLRPVRAAFWFEKFFYFISSEGYLVIGGKDAMQSEIIYRRHLKKGDVFVHAELDGALPLVVKNRPGHADSPIPPGTLSQAGHMCVSTSTAWDSKAVMSAWWAEAERVTKKASTGDVLGPGKFAIKGEKMYLPPAQLLLGFAVLFQISEKSKARHMKHRVKDDAAADIDASEATPSAADMKPVNGNDNAGGLDEDEDDVAEDDDHEEDDDEHNETADEEEMDNSRSNPLQSQAAQDDDEPDDAEDEKDQDATVPESSNTEAQAQSEAQDAAAASSSDDDGDEPEAPTTSAPPTHSSTPNNAKTPLPTRGKKGKAKKIAKKYADQDAADREEAMRLLGSTTGQVRAQDEAAAKAQRDKEAAAARQRRREQHAKRAQEAAEHDVGDAAVDDDDDALAEVDLDAFVGNPLPGDTLLDALPICAPWSALGRYKYKAKLQPGSAKKGKAVREILGRWAHDAGVKRFVDERAEDPERIWPRESELIKGWKETEVFGVVPVGKVRVMMPGGSAGGKDVKKGGKRGWGGRGKKK